MINSCALCTYQEEIQGKGAFLLYSLPESVYNFEACFSNSS